MSFVGEYTASELSRREVDGLTGATLLEFGNPWCGHCCRAQPLIEEAFVSHGGVRHIRIADASGRRLGRSFGVKLWPTLVSFGRLIQPQFTWRLTKSIPPEDDPEAPGRITRTCHPCRNLCGSFASPPLNKNPAIHRSG